MSSPSAFPSPQLSVMKGELGEAEEFLHQALRLSHRSDNRKAIVYTYSMVRLRGAGGAALAALPLAPR